MKTNKSFSASIGIGILAIAFTLNLAYASNDYGISDNSLSAQVLAQTNRSGSGSSSGSGSGSGSESGTGTDTDIRVGVVMDRPESKNITTCDKTSHYYGAQKGVFRTCLGEGNIKCESPGWNKSGGADGPQTFQGYCPGKFICPINPF